jgi:NADH-quinone oxidoreductase subunit J
VEPQLVIFTLLAAVGLGSAVMVITRKNPVHSALYLVVTFFSVAGIYVVLGAAFLAAVQVLVYAGGIMVLFLFVIMLVDTPEHGGTRRIRGKHAGAAALLTALVTGLLGYLLASAGALPAAADTGMLAAHGGNLETVATSLFQYYLLPFEVVSILLLVAMVGAIVLARAKA